MPTDQHLFCFGLGYTAGFLTATLREQGWSVSGTSRQIDTVRQLCADGIHGYAFDGATAIDNMAAALATVTHMLISIPPDADGDPVLRHHRNEILQAPNLKWIGYLSTTGVYGDHGGQWVDEETPVQPSLPRTKRRVQAEQDWLALGRSKNFCVQVFRLAGIYGPGRNPLVSLQKGQARRIDKPGQVFSRIHVRDIVQILVRAMEPQAAPAQDAAIFNVCDDCPEAPHIVVGFAAQLLGMTPPPLVPFAEAEMSPMARSFYADNRRVSNRRVKTALNLALLYPDYQAGLKALHAEIAGSK